MNDEPLIALRDICREFQVGDETVHALDHVSLDIHAGDYISVMGPSGSGKSTLLNMLGLLDQTNAGSYRFVGRELTTLPEEQRAQVRRDNIGFIFQSFHLIPRLTAAENVELPLVLTGMPASERKVKVRQALAGLGLADRADHRPAQLSGGQQQRVAIARATIMHAPLLLADEPTGNLDSNSSKEIMNILKGLHAEGSTVILITHDNSIAEQADRIINIIDGRIEKDHIKGE